MDTLGRWLLYAIGIVAGAFLAAIGWVFGREAGEELLNRWAERRRKNKGSTD